MASPSDIPPQLFRLVLWDGCSEGGWASQFDRLLRDDDRFNPEVRKLAGPVEMLGEHDVPPDTHLLVLAIPSSHTAAGVAALRRLRKHGMLCPVAVLTDTRSEALLLQWADAGAADFIPLPLRKAEVFARLALWNRALSEVQAAADTLTREFALGQIIGESPAIQSQIQKLRCYARCDSTVLISGETGTGKEVFARAIHYTGRRAAHPFLPVNCAALPVELVENELFGHESGAFTGARQAYRGLIREAEGGTLFLDEIDSLPAPAQAKLLRFLQEREYRPLGAARTRRADVRIISASNSNLAAAVRSGRLREDLYFRLNVLALMLPSLRERRADIPLLADHLLRRHCETMSRPAARFSPSAMQRLTAYDWPGNVRELENVVERALALTAGNVIEEGNVDLPAASPPPADESFKAQKLKVIISFERRYLSDILARNGGNIARAARAAHKDRRAFFELLRKHNLAGGTRTTRPVYGIEPRPLRPGR